MFTKIVTAGLTLVMVLGLWFCTVYSFLYLNGEAQAGTLVLAALTTVLFVFYWGEKR